MRLICRLGLHVFVRYKVEQITYPKLGPYDPRSDQKRTEFVKTKICAQCGVVKQYNDSVLYV